MAAVVESVSREWDLGDPVRSTRLNIIHDVLYSRVIRTAGPCGLLIQVEKSFHGDVGMSLHEKERNKKMPTPRHKVTHNPIPTSLFCFDMLFVCLL